MLVHTHQQILALIGEVFDTTDVCGCVVSVRPALSRIALWVKDGDNINSYKPLGYVDMEPKHSNHCDQIGFVSLIVRVYDPNNVSRCRVFVQRETEISVGTRRQIVGVQLTSSIDEATRQIGNICFVNK
jgi:hypothetical protein